MANAINISTTHEAPKDELHDELWLITLRFVIVGLGIAMNAVVTGVFMYIRMYRKSLLHALVVQQSFVDFFGCCMFLFFYNQDAPSGNDGKAFCKARTLFWIAIATSTYNLVMITIERFIAVVHPVTYRKRSIGKRSRLFYIIPYIIAFFIYFHLAIIADVREDLVGECRYYYRNSEVSLFSGLFICMTIFFLPAGLMTYCYGRILFKFRQRARARQQQQRAESDKRSYHISVHRNLVYTMFFVVIGFVFTTAPNIILYLVYTICHCFEFSTITVHEITVLITTCNMCINPIIYGAKMNDFRSGLRKIWRNTLLLAGRDVADESTTVNNCPPSRSNTNTDDTRL